GVGDERAPLEGALYGLGGDVLAPRGHDDVLLAVGDGEEAVLQHSDVAGVEPALAVDGLRGGLGLLVVALHDVRAAGQDLAVGRDLDLHALHGRTDRARPEILRAVHRDDRARLGEAVA